MCSETTAQLNESAILRFAVRLLNPTTDNGRYRGLTQRRRTGADPPSLTCLALPCLAYRMRGCPPASCRNATIHRGTWREGRQATKRDRGSFPGDRKEAFRV